MIWGQLEVLNGGDHGAEFGLRKASVLEGFCEAEVTCRKLASTERPRVCMRVEDAFGLWCGPVFPLADEFDVADIRHGKRGRGSGRSCRGRCRVHIMTEIGGEGDRCVEGTRERRRRQGWWQQAR